jgi:hypothetical protein
MTPQISALHKPIDKVSRYLVRKHKMLIGEEWRDAVSGKTFDAYDPATGKVIASVPEGDAPDIDLAVKAGVAYRLTSVRKSCGAMRSSWKPTARSWRIST